MRLLSHLAQIKHSPCAFINAAERFFTTAPGNSFPAAPGTRWAQMCPADFSSLACFASCCTEGPKSSPWTLWRSLGSCWLWAGSCQGTWGSLTSAAHTSVPYRLQRPSSLIPERFQREPRITQQRSRDFRTVVLQSQ